MIPYLLPSFLTSNSLHFHRSGGFSVPDLLVRTNPSQALAIRPAALFPRRTLAQPTGIRDCAQVYT